MIATQDYGTPEGDVEFADLAQLHAVSFNSEIDKIRDRWWAYAGLDNLRVLRRNGAVVGGLVDIPMGSFFGGRSVPTHGVAGVGVAPQARGQGAATQLMTSYLAELREKGVALSSLFASTDRLYRGVGYGFAGLCFKHRFHHGAFSGTRDLEVRPLLDPAPAKALYTRVAAAHPGWLDRGPYIWHRVFSDAWSPVWSFGVWVDDVLEGYLVYRQKDNPDDRHVLVISDMQASTERAARRLLGLVASHSTMITEVRWHGAARDPVLDLLDENRGKTTLYEPWMLRLVDLPAAIAARGYAPVVTARVELDVVDDTLPDNAGRWVLDVADGRGRLTRGGSGRVVVPAFALAGIYSGYRSVPALAVQGRIEGDFADLAALGGIFAGPPPEVVDSY